MRRDRREFDAFVRGIGGGLLHWADLLTGDPVRAERRFRYALARTYLQWRHAAEADPMRLARRALMAGYLDPWRPLPWRPQRPADGPEDARTEALRALDRLTRLERAVAVLRGYAELDDFDTADALEVSVETVRNAHTRAAARLRAGSTAARHDHERHGEHGEHDDTVWEADPAPRTAEPAP